MVRHVIAAVDELPPGTRKFLEIDGRHNMPRHQDLSLRMISFGKQVPAFPDHAIP